MDKSTRKDDMLEVLAGFEDVALKEEKLGDCSQTTLQARIVSTSNQVCLPLLISGLRIGLFKLPCPVQLLGTTPSKATTSKMETAILRIAP
eukprot:6178619-Pleurochrysis_carterae.AAC.1